MFPFVKRIALAGLTSMLVVSSAASGAERTTVIALVASSDKAAFAEIAAAYEKAHPDVHVVATYVGSKLIASEVTSGAQIDVILTSSAVLPGMASYLDTPQTAYASHLAVAVSKKMAGKITSAKDLAAGGVRIGAGTAGSFVGTYDAATLDKLTALYGPAFRAHYTGNVALSLGDVEHLSSSIKSGAIDAALMWRENVDPATMVSVALPPEAAYTLGYDVASVKSSTHGAAARDFSAFVAGPQGAAIHHAHGADK